MPTSIYLLKQGNSTSWALAYCDTKDQAHDLAPWTNSSAYLLSSNEGTTHSAAEKMASLPTADFRGVFRQPPPTKTYQLVDVQVLVQESDADHYVTFALAGNNRVIKSKVTGVTTVELTDDQVKEALK